MCGCLGHFQLCVATSLATVTASDERFHVAQLCPLLWPGVWAFGDMGRGGQGDCQSVGWPMRTGWKKTEPASRTLVGGDRLLPYQSGKLERSDTRVFLSHMLSPHFGSRLCFVRQERAISSPLHASDFPRQAAFLPARGLPPLILSPGRLDATRPQSEAISDHRHRPRPSRSGGERGDHLAVAPDFPTVFRAHMR